MELNFLFFLLDLDVSSSPSTRERLGGEVFSICVTCFTVATGEIFSGLLGDSQTSGVATSVSKWQLAQQQRPSDSGELPVKKSLLVKRHCEELVRPFLLVAPVTADEPEEGGTESVVELDSAELVMMLW